MRARLIVPCFNEQHRLDRARFAELAQDPKIELLFVDDGSKDGTGEVLADLARSTAGRIAILALERNSGKGEAVRRGLVRALEDGATAVGYTDADLSTPPAELVKLLDHLDRPDVHAVVAARVKLVGRRIERDAMRHFLGRVFAGIAATILDTAFYDTQCGAKFFRASPLLRKALARPFVSRWAFDVELLGRLLIGIEGARGLVPGQLIEVPVDEWTDVDGSKLHWHGMAKTLVDLARIRSELERLRADRVR